jgi:hypothetical protein
LTPAFYVIVQEFVDEHFNNRKDEEEWKDFIPKF